MTTTDADFIKRLKDSQRGVYVIANYLMGLGHTCTLKPLRIRPDASQWKQYQDEGDLFIQGRIEVKHLSTNFTGLDDYPYKDFVIVCEQKAHDSANPKPCAYFLLSQDEQHAGIIYGRTSPQWELREVIDRRRGHPMMVYTCPLSVVQFVNVEKKNHD